MCGSLQLTSHQRDVQREKRKTLHHFQPPRADLMPGSVGQDRSVRLLCIVQLHESYVAHELNIL